MQTVRVALLREKGREVFPAPFPKQICRELKCAGQPCRIAAQTLLVQMKPILPGCRVAVDVDLPC